jgi:hypothetical protein
MQMECGTPTRKRALSATEPTSPPKRKKMKNVPYRPILRLDCTVSPGPKPMLCTSAMRFSIDSSSGSTGSLHHSAVSYQHHSYSQNSYSQRPHGQQPPRIHPQNYHPPYYKTLNYQPPDHQYSNYQSPNHQNSNYQLPDYQYSEYQPPNCRLSNYQPTPLWGEFVGRYQPASNANFIDMCQTSEAKASCSSYSSFSNRGGSFKDIPHAASKYASKPLPEKNGDDCEAFLRILFECLTRVKETLTTAQSTMEELTQLAPLLSFYK